MGAEEDAWAAIRYVKTTAKVLSYNHPAELNKQEIDDRERQRRNTKAAELMIELLGKAGDNMALDIAAKAQAAKQCQIGNCEGQASLAYAYIVENTESKSSVAILGPMGYDHVFLVIGKQGTKKWNDPTVWTDPGEWSNDAVICDPWATDVYPVTQLLLKMKQLYKDTGFGMEEDETEVIASCKLDSRDPRDKWLSSITT